MGDAARKPGGGSRCFGFWGGFMFVALCPFSAVPLLRAVPVKGCVIMQGSSVVWLSTC